jgi:uncharacterized protein YggU (UPF0235/DUF167 family)
MRREIHVRPNASETAVGGAHDGALVVRVRERADQGKATAAALKAVASAVGLPAHSVTLVRGSTSRRKLIEVSASPADEIALSDRWDRLLKS